MNKPSDTPDSVESVSPDDSDLLRRVRQVFDDTIAGERDPDRIANIEICREYFLNADFRKKLEDLVAAINGV